MAKPDLYLMIAACGRPHLLERTLQSLSQCEFPPKYRQTLIIENGEPSGIEQLVRSVDPRLKAEYCFEPQGSKSLALNRGLAKVESGLIIFSDDDVRFDANLLLTYSQMAEHFGPSHFFGGAVDIDYEYPPEEWLRKLLPPSAKGWRPFDHIAEMRLPDFLGCNWAAYAEDLHDKGGFSEAYGPGAASSATGQETEIQTRLLRAGIRGMYLPEPVVWHYVPKERCDMHWLLRRSYRGGVAKGLKYRKRGRRICGIPRWVVRDSAKWALQLGKSTIALRRSAAFEARYELRRLCGFVHGLRLAESTCNDSR